ncbi:hypothetical protein [Escherichia coli]|nr:hypothetical protein [Escherichia coli]
MRGEGEGEKGEGERERVGRGRGGEERGKVNEEKRKGRENGGIR